MLKISILGKTILSFLLITLEWMTYFKHGSKRLHFFTIDISTLHDLRIWSYFFINKFSSEFSIKSVALEHIYSNSKTEKNHRRLKLYLCLELSRMEYFGIFRNIRLSAYLHSVNIFLISHWSRALILGNQWNQFKSIRRLQDNSEWFMIIQS